MTALSTHRRQCCSSWMPPTIVRLVLVLLLVGVCAVPCCNGADASTAPMWHLHAYHLYRRQQTATSVGAEGNVDAAPVLLGETDLQSDTCAVDSIWESPLKRKMGPPTSRGRQSLSLNLSTMLIPLTPSRVFSGQDRDVAGPQSPLRRSEAEMTSSPPVEGSTKPGQWQRDAVPTQSHTVGQLHLGMFLAEEIGAYTADVIPFVDVGGDDDDDNGGAGLGTLVDLNDETERDYEISIFAGDLTSQLCLSAALYPTWASVGNVSEALATWVTSSVSPACGLRLRPSVILAFGIPLDDDDVQPGWPPSREQQCRLREAHKFTFRFRPALGLAVSPAFCAYEAAQNATLLPAVGSRRHLRCSVYLEIKATTWYSSTFLEHADVASLKLAAAVSAVPSPAETIGDRSGGVGVGRANAAASLIAGGLSRYKGMTWCTAAHVGQGFWLSDATACAASLTEELGELKGGAQRDFVMPEVVLMLLLAGVLMVMCSFTTTVAVRAVRSYRRRGLTPH